MSLGTGGGWGNVHADAHPNYRLSIARSCLVANRSRDFLGCLPHLGRPCAVKTIRWCGYRQSGYKLALIVIDAGADARDALFCFLIVEGKSLAAYLLQFLAEAFRIRKRVVGKLRQPCSTRVLDRSLGPFLCQKYLAYRSDVQWSARSDDLHHPHHRAAVGSALYVDDLIVMPHR